jgi:DNA-directed RNA polymerase sigma subunit (sigma70/sigma32)
MGWIAFNMIADIEQLEQSLELLEKALAMLDERDRVILVARYGLDGTKPKTLLETGALIRRTRARVASLQQRALCRLRWQISNLKAFAYVEGCE